MELREALEKLESHVRAGLAGVSTLNDLDALRARYLGRKGELATLMSGLASLPANERPAIGELANKVKNVCAGLIGERKTAIEESLDRAELARFDPSVPGRVPWEGSLHPTTLVTEEISAIFTRLGYDIVVGPEVEIDRFNFEALNMPPEHPARDMQDTLYIDGNVLLRTHTSPVQIRSMLARKPPLAVIAPGKVYRRDSDLTHTPMFHQAEGLMVAQKVSMADLRGTLLYMVRELFGQSVSLRFRPSFFPFTEPSAEADISCSICGGTGSVRGEPCRVCKATGWVEILGCGMVDPNVFAAVGYENASGFAFGLGIERVAMLKYGVSDLRVFFQNDNRFLEQFGYFQ